MKQLKFNNQEYKLVSSWSEMSEKQILRTCFIRSKHLTDSDQIALNASRIILFTILTDVPKKLVEEITAEQWVDILPHLNFVFETPDIFFEKEEEIEGKSRELELAMFGLSDREIEILNCYFGIYKDPMTLESIGDNFGLTKERVRQIKEASIRKIRNNLGGVKTSEIFR